MTLVNWSWSFMAFYLGLMLFIGYIASKRIAHADDFATARGSYGPWGRAIILHETISVLTQYTVHLAKFPVRGPAVGWVMTSVFDKEDTLVAECLLNQAMVKESYERYAEEAVALHRLLTK